MSTVQIDGSSSVTSSSTKNDGGTVVKGGTPASDSPMTNNLNLKDLNTGTDSGSKVVAQSGTAGDKAGVQAANSGGTGGLAFFPDATKGERNFLIRGAGTTDGNNEINNDASSVLTIPASDGDGVAPQTLIVTTRQLGEFANADGSTSTVRAFNVLARPSTAIVPGRTKGTDEGVESTFVNPADGSAAVKSEIVPSRSVPGELTYHFGGLAKPTTDEYKARDAKE